MTPTKTDLGHAKRGRDLGDRLRDELIAADLPPKFAIATACHVAMVVAEHYGFGPMQFGMLALKIFQKYAGLTIVNGVPCEDCGEIHVAPTDEEVPPDEFKH